jgi:hypothetical protein
MNYELIGQSSSDSPGRLFRALPERETACQRCVFDGGSRLAASKEFNRGFERRDIRDAVRRRAPLWADVTVTGVFCGSLLVMFVAGGHRLRDMGVVVGRTRMAQIEHLRRNGEQQYDDATELQEPPAAIRGKAHHSSLMLARTCARAQRARSGLFFVAFESCVDRNRLRYSYAVLADQRL